MPRRSATKASRNSRTARAPAVPTPIHSAYTTPLSSAHPSTYASEVEADPDDDVSKIPIGTLTLADGSSRQNKTSKQEKPFRFLDLPSELRVKVYRSHFAGAGDVVDLDPDNRDRIFKKLAILRTCRTIYLEASHLFYSTQTFRVFPTHHRYIKVKKPLLVRLNRYQRGLLTSLDVRFGPGWNNPPRSWVVNDALKLAECANVRKLNVFVECDPSDGTFSGFRRGDGFYEDFSRNLLAKVLERIPSIELVCFDAWPSVSRSGAMMRGLLEVVATRGGLKIGWGPQRGWSDHDDEAKFADPLRSAIAKGLLPSLGKTVAVVA